jgi:hypothetical protein
MKLVPQLGLPLIHQVWRTNHGKAGRLTPVAKFTRDERGFNGLADTNIVGDEQPDGILAQGHQERDQLIGTRLDGDTGKATERAGGSPYAEAGSLPQQAGGLKIAGLLRVRRRKFGSVDGFNRRQNASALIFCTANGSYENEFVRGFREDNPLATTR